MHFDFLPGVAPEYRCRTLVTAGIRFALLMICFAVLVKDDDTHLGIRSWTPNPSTNVLAGIIYPCWLERSQAKYAALASPEDLWHESCKMSQGYWCWATSYKVLAAAATAAQNLDGDVLHAVHIHVMCFELSNQHANMAALLLRHTSSTCCGI